MLLPQMPLEFLARATEGSNALEPANAPVYWALRPYLRIAPRTAPARGKAAALFAQGPTAPRPNLAATLGALAAAPTLRPGMALTTGRGARRIGAATAGLGGTGTGAGSAIGAETSTGTGPGDGSRTGLHRMSGSKVTGF